VGFRNFLRSLASGKAEARAQTAGAETAQRSLSYGEILIFDPQYARISIFNTQRTSLEI
jgi:hypothetical protein